MKLSLQHPDDKIRIQRFSELAALLRSKHCAQDRSAVWTPRERVERVVRGWATEQGLRVTKEPEQLVIVL